MCQDVIAEEMEKDPKLKTMLQFGDYNFPFISWPSKSIYQGNQQNRLAKSSEKELFINFMNENFLENFCLIPTRGSNILDLILSNDPGLIGQIYTVVSKGISDHNLLEINVEHPYTRPTESGSREVPYSNTFHQYNLQMADEEDWLRYKAELMEVDFHTITKGMNVEQKLSKLYSIFESATALIFTKKKELITNEEDKEENDEKKRSKNKIPKDIRLLMRQIR